MTKAPPGFTRTLLSIAVPVTLQNLLASSFTLIDTMMIGKLGDTPLAAVGMSCRYIRETQVNPQCRQAGMNIQCVPHCLTNTLLPEGVVFVGHG